MVGGQQNHEQWMMRAINYIHSRDINHPSAGCSYVIYIVVPLSLIDSLPVYANYSSFLLDSGAVPEISVRRVERD